MLRGAPVRGRAAAVLRVEREKCRENSQEEQVHPGQHRRFAGCVLLICSRFKFLSCNFKDILSRVTTLLPQQRRFGSEAAAPPGDFLHLPLHPVRPGPERLLRAEDPQVPVLRAERLLRVPAEETFVREQRRERRGGRQKKEAVVVSCCQLLVERRMRGFVLTTQ